MSRSSFRLGVIILIALFILLLIEKFSPADNSTRFIDETIRTERVLNKSKLYPPGIELQEVKSFVNSNSLTLSSLVGRKVVLLHFWSSSCVPCRNDFLVLNSWSQRYSSDGLAVVGVQSPEFSFESVFDNVKNFVESKGIKYPVALDSEGRTFDAYGAKSRPEWFLIDIDGFIRYRHDSSDNYEFLETEIRELLSERSEILFLPEINSSRVKVDIPDFFLDSQKKKDLYVGSEYGRHDFGNPQGLRQSFAINYSLPIYPSVNKVYASGLWLANANNIALEDTNGALFIKTDSKRIHMTAGSGANSSLEVFVDGVSLRKFSVKDTGVYEIASFDNYAPRDVKIVFTGEVLVYKLTIE